MLWYESAEVVENVEAQTRIGKLLKLKSEYLDCLLYFRFWICKKIKEKSV